jgi:hypothetical protein
MPILRQVGNRSPNDCLPCELLILRLVNICRPFVGWEIPIRRLRFASTPVIHSRPLQVYKDKGEKFYNRSVFF